MRVAGRRVPGVAELAFRARQEADKWRERTHPPATPRVRAITPATFFPGAQDRDIARHCERLVPGHVAGVIEAAARVAAGRFDLLGHSDLSFGDPIDWHHDVVNGRRAPRWHWTRIDPLDPAAVGDSKVIWELNRHQWIVTLAQAWRLAARAEMAGEALDQIEAWTRENPYGLGINWTSSLEAAFRVMSWSWVLVLLGDAPAMTPSRRRTLQSGIATHAAYIARYLSRYFSPNTHLTGEALGLFYAGTLLDGTAPRAWRALGARILDAEAPRQILADGVHFEQATGYQRYTIEIYLHYLLLARASGHDVPPEVAVRVERALVALLALCRPDGMMPPIGDADGGWLLPLARRRHDDPRAAFSIAAALFRRADFAWAAQGLAPETLWLMGAEGARAFAALEPHPPAAAPSTLLPDGGYVVMRSSWGREAHQLVFDVGPLGCPASGGHGHADLLSVQASPFGEACLVDAGTGEYVDLRGWRTAFRRSQAHSTVCVDGASQAEPAGPFSWRGSRPRAVLHAWRAMNGGDLADASHRAFRTPNGAVSHRRRVLALGALGWIVVDDLGGAGRHHVELHWQFAPLPVAPAGGGAVLASLGSGRGLWVIPVAPMPMTDRLTTGADHPSEGWHSPAYGVRTPAPHLVLSAVAALPLRLATLLLATVAPGPLPPRVTWAGDAAGRLSCVQVPALGIDLAIDDKDIRSCAA